MTVFSSTHCDYTQKYTIDRLGNGFSVYELKNYTNPPLMIRRFLNIILERSRR